MLDHKLISNMLEKSRFNRRLHSVSMLINDLFHQVGMVLKEISDSTEYLLDSFPVPICDNIRIFNVKIIQSAQYRAEPETLRLRVTSHRKNDIFTEFEFSY